MVITCQNCSERADGRKMQAAGPEQVHELSDAEKLAWVEGFSQTYVSSMAVKQTG